MTVEDKEMMVAKSFLRFFEEKSPLDYDILDSMIQEINQKNPNSK